MGPSTEISKYTIVIIQSLKDGDLKTGEMLYDKLSASLPTKYPDTSVKLFDVKDKLDLAVIFHGICSGIADGELITLQIEAHGCEEGVDLASGELVTWKDFFGMIRPINEKMLNLLLVCMSMCYGGAMITEFEPEKRAPYRAFIGTGRAIRAGTLLDGFSAFYENYHNLRDVFSAYEAMKKAAIDSATGECPFWFMSSEDVFKKTLDPDRDPDSFRHIVNEQYVRQKVEGKDVSWNQVEAKVREILIETHKRYFEHYTFRDILKKI